MTQVQHELEELHQFLDQFGDIASGDTLTERVEAVVRHYATQMGRWVGHPGMPKGYRFERLICPVCGDEVAANWYVRHMNKSHSLES